MNRLHRFVATRSVAQIHAQGAIVCALVAGLIVAAGLPALSRHSDTVAMRAAVEAAETRLQRTRAQIDESKREMATLTERLGQAAATGSSSATLDRRLLDVSSVATEFGLLVDTVEPGTVTKRADGDVTPLVVSGRGDYPNIVAYLARIRAAAPDLTVETAQVTATAENSCAFRLTLNWFSPPAAAARVFASIDGGN